MRYMVIAVLALLASCSPFGFNPEGYEILSEPLEVAWPKSAALHYIADTDPEDQWKSPHQTIADGGGDCEDIATVLLYYLGPSAELVGIKTGSIYHCIVKYEGKYLEAQSVGVYYDPATINIYETISYESVMRTATHWGTQNISMN